MAVRVEELEGGAFWQVTLDAPKANVLDGAMIGELTQVFCRAQETQGLKAICLQGAGAHFSFGASVKEHLPEQVAGMLHSFHDLFRTIAGSSVVTLAALRGQCLGGGLELAAFCHRIFASADARLGQPEIKLGVFAPVASLLLPERMSRSAAEDLCLSGRVLTAAEALQHGLVDELCEDPAAAALAYAHEHLLSHSASSLSFAAQAVRHAFNERFFRNLQEVERLYLEELMATTDAKEGITSFLQKREPQWKHA